MRAACASSDRPECTPDRLSIPASFSRGEETNPHLVVVVGPEHLTCSRSQRLGHASAHQATFGTLVKPARPILGSPEAGARAARPARLVASILPSGRPASADTAGECSQAPLERLRLKRDGSPAGLRRLHLPYPRRSFAPRVSPGPFQLSLSHCTTCTRRTECPLTLAMLSHRFGPADFTQRSRTTSPLRPSRSATKSSTLFASSAPPHSSTHAGSSRSKRGESGSGGGGTN